MYKLLTINFLKYTYQGTTQNEIINNEKGMEGVIFRSAMGTEAKANSKFPTLCYSYKTQTQVPQPIKPKKNEEKKNLSLILLGLSCERQVNWFERVTDKSIF